MKKTLRPIHDRDSYSDYVMKTIDYALYQLIYKPLLTILGPQKENARADVLAQAFASGRIWFFEGFVYGNFSGTISKQLRDIGAKYLPSKKAFKLSLSQLPPALRSAIAHRAQLEKDKLAELRKVSADLKKADAVVLKFDASLDKTLADLEKQFHKVTPKDLEVPMEMNDYVRDQLKEKFEENVHSYVWGWSNEAIDRLRYKIEQNATAGFRADRMQQMIMSEYGITKNRAKQIAKQETSLLVSKYRQVRYEAAGVTKYIWSTSQDERVRDDHKDLNGKEFSFDNPPIVDKATGRRANPGEDFGCRCVALPVVTFAGVE